MRVPDESTVGKLVRRLGPATVNELTGVVIGKPSRRPGFWPGRCGSTPPWSRPTSATRPMGCWPPRHAPTIPTLAGSHPPGRSSRAGPSRAPGAPAGAGPAPAPAARAAAATSSAATGCGAAAFEGDHGQRIWSGWAVLAYNLDTLAIHTA
jgi:hypothetical protein